MHKMNELRTLPRDSQPGDGFALPCQSNVSRSELLVQAQVQSFAWTENTFAEFFGGATQPRRAARAWAARLERQGMLHSSLIDCQEIAIGDKPLCASWMRDCDMDRVAYALERRFRGSSRPIRVFWPSEEFAKRHGSWTGAENYPCPHKASHDLLITRVWLELLKTRPRTALTCWTSERALVWSRKIDSRRGPTPDALITAGERVTAIEIGGAYPAAWLRHHIERFESQSWAWEIW